MKRYCIGLSILYFCSAVCFSQTSSKSKRSLDTSVLGKWPIVSNGAISNNGLYVQYIVKEFIPVLKTTTIIQTPDGKWKKELEGVLSVKFSNDSKYVLYLDSDSLHLLNLISAQCTVIPHVLSFHLVPFRKGEWLVYQLKNNSNLLIIRNFQTGKERKFSLVEKYFFSNDGETVIIHTRSKDKIDNQLIWIRLVEGKQSNIWQGTSAQPLQLIFDSNGFQLAFTIEEKDGRSLWHYMVGMLQAKELAKDGNINLTNQNKGLVIGNLDRFSRNGSRIFFNLEKREVLQKPESGSVNVNVWSYKDRMLQSEQLEGIKGKKEVIRTFYSMLEIATNKIVQLQHDFEKLVSSINNDDFCISYHLDTDQDVSQWEKPWNAAIQGSSVILISTKNGSRIKLPWEQKESGFTSSFSPFGKYIIYQEHSSLNYFTYELATGILRNISQGISADLSVGYYYNQPAGGNTLIGYAGWLNNDAGVLIYDRYDIWLVDPSGKKAPENITNGFGSRNHTILRLTKFNYESSPNVVHLNENMLLVAFDQRTKKNGYFKIILGQKSDPEKLIMEDCLYGDVPIFSQLSAGLIKAQNAKAWLVERQSSTEFPNYFWTNDLKKFERVSNLHPEKDWNWLTSDLHQWVGLDGDTIQGILYKPENFDPSKKYPVLLRYYEEFSDEMHVYRMPAWTSSQINIPWFISQGYLVFTPDIHVHSQTNSGELKKTVLNSLISAKEYLSKLNYVDGQKIGAQGHSFGGLETGCLVTGTNIFAAASAACGYYNMTSDVGTLQPYGAPRGGASDRNNGGSLWEKPENFIKNSPIFHADNVSTPLLMVSGVQDGQVPHAQSIEFFMALRRLGKTVWMLTYDDEGHTITRKTQDSKDYTLRMTQFFAHYLKGASAPAWMTQTIPAKLKGRKTGYELDPAGECSKNCKICKMWNEKYNRDSAAVIKEIELKE